MGLFTLILYNLALITTLVVLAPLWMGYLLLVPKTRAGFWQKLGYYPVSVKTKLAQRDLTKKRVWFHAVSVGEFNAIKSLIPELAEHFDIVISTTTLTGNTLAQKTFPQLPILYFPYDLPGPTQKAVQTIEPDLMILTETEIWPNFIDRVTRGHRIPLIMINGRLSQRSFQSYQRIRHLIRPCLRQMTHFYMQSQPDADRIAKLGKIPPEQITVAGNLKFDLIPTLNPEQRTFLGHLLNLHDDDTILTLASTHSGEDLPLIETYLQLKQDFPELKLILAPRHPERLSEIMKILNSKALNYSVRSQLTEDSPNPHAIVILNSIGELLTVYSFSRIAVMGGSFVERGGQNPLEPLSQKVPVIFGPYMHNFAEISRMVLESEAGYQVKKPSELINAVTALLTQPEIYDTVVEKGQQLIENNRGAKAIIHKAIDAI